MLLPHALILNSHRDVDRFLPPMFDEFSAVSLDDNEDQRKRKDEAAKKGWRLSFDRWLLAWDRCVKYHPCACSVS